MRGVLFEDGAVSLADKLPLLPYCDHREVRPDRCSAFFPASLQVRKASVCPLPTSFVILLEPFLFVKTHR